MRWRNARPDVLIEDGLNERVIRRVVTAAGDVVPLWLGHRRAAELNDPARDHAGVAQLVCGVLHQLSNHCFFHRSFHDLGAEPVLIIGEPLIRESHVEQL
jgi:hypothetical protein